MDELKKYLKIIEKRDYILNITSLYKPYKDELLEIIKNRKITEKFKTNILICESKKNYAKKYFTIKKFSHNLFLIISTEDIYLSGFYKKFSRTISQSKFSYENIPSVENHLLIEMKKYCTGYFIFSGVGREDIDVLQLGGRMFFLRIKNSSARNFDFLRNLIIENADVEFFNLKISSKQQMNENMERKFNKEYKIVLLSKEEIPIERIVLNRKFTIRQRTPLRVLHRRANLLREKYIYIREIKMIRGGRYELIVETEAGLYVKEFIHGDFHRSESLSSLFNLNIQMELETLDVTKILY